MTILEIPCLEDVQDVQHVKRTEELVDSLNMEFKKGSSMCMSASFQYCFISIRKFRIWKINWEYGLDMEESIMFNTENTSSSSMDDDDNCRRRNFSASLCYDQTAREKREPTAPVLDQKSFEIGEGHPKLERRR